MFNYAQTSIQLYHQLKKQKYSTADIILINRTYEIATEFFAGCYRPSGKTFMAHVVGTASILISLNISATIISASLIHSIYQEGDFGNYKQGFSFAKRKKIKSLLGEEIETYVFNYANFKWNYQEIIKIRDNLESMTSLEKDLILMRLADQLEDCLDLGILYCSNGHIRKQSLQNKKGFLVEIAHKIGFPKLAEELEKEIDNTINGQLLTELINVDYSCRSFYIPPKSYWQKPHLWFQVNIINNLSNFLNKIIKKYFSLVKNKIKKVFQRLINNLSRIS